MFFKHVTPPDMNVTSDPVLPNIPLPQVFKATSAWTYTGSPYVSPCLGTKVGALPPIKDPTPQYVTAPDRVIKVNPPGSMEYIPIPPETKADRVDDPTGMKSLMEFLGFNKAQVSAASSQLDGGINQAPGMPLASNAGPMAQGTGDSGIKQNVSNALPGNSSLQGGPAAVPYQTINQF
jgi:hypothetical protein